MANVGPNTWYCRAVPGVDVFPINVVTGGSGPTRNMTGVNAPAGALIIVCVAESVAASGGTLSDSVNGSYSVAASGAMAAAAGFGTIFYFPNSATLTNATITYTMNGSSNTMGMSALYVTGIAATTPLDTGFTPTAATGTSTAPSVTSNAPAQQHEFVIGSVFWSNAANVSGTLSGAFGTPPWIASGQHAATVQGGWVLNGGTLPVTFAMTLTGANSNWMATCVAFKVATTPTAGWYGVTPWPVSTAVAVGVLRRQNAPPGIGNRRVFACVVAGTTGSTEPAWTITQGAKTTDNTVTWIEVTAQPGVNGDTTSSPTWLQNKGIAVTTGLVIYDSTSGSLQVVTTAGTTGSGSQPSFSATAGVTTSDNTATWTSLGLASGFTAWGAPFGDLHHATTWVATGDTVYVSDDHLEVIGPNPTSSYTLNWPGTTFPPTAVVCADHTQAVPPSQHLTTGAKSHFIPNFTAGSPTFSYTGQGSVWYHGITFNAGSCDIVGSAGGYTGQGHFTSCTFNFTGSCNMGKEENGPVIASACTFTGGGAFANIACGMHARLRNCTINGTFGSYFVSPHGNNGAGFGIVEDCDFGSTVSGLSTIFQTTTAFSWGGASYLLRNCLLPTGVPVGVNTSAINRIILVNCDSGTAVYRHEAWDRFGSHVASTTILRTGGASDGTTPLSWAITTTVDASWPFPFWTLDLAVNNTAVGVTRTVTVYGLAEASTLPTNANLWLSLDYYGSPTSVQGTLLSSGTSNGLATGAAYTADSTSVWNSNTPARVNGATYTSGQAISVSSNNRVFFCTVGGVAAGSLPAGYATAVDGGSVTDGTATFVAGVRFKMTLTLSAPQPQLAGYIRGQVKVALPSANYWIDPKLWLS